MGVLQALLYKFAREKYYFGYIIWEGGSGVILQLFCSTLLQHTHTTVYILSPVLLNKIYLWFYSSVLIWAQ